ncbi:peptidyl-glycine alpha-amidating monooxygenase, partial [Protobothrops mucrosquamatus]|uniref:peptidyl-glycine alpha-amidating monooxygenase n=1 Tax=Protobothrops mucrosquamatus TaxID=103944 RepID=UPI00077567A3
DFYSLISRLLGEREDVVHLHKYNPAENAESDFVAEIANVVQKKDLGWPDARAFSKNDKRANAILVRDRIHKFHRLESTLRPPENRHVALQQNKPSVGNWEKEQTGGLKIEEVADWPGITLKLGQVSGLALDPNNNLVIFHRGDHVWDANSFNSSYVYQQKGLGPIKENTILVVEASTSTILHSTGRNMFYLPHGLSIDNNGNYWVTDVALHQVFKLASDGVESPFEDGWVTTPSPRSLTLINTQTADDIISITKTSVGHAKPGQFSIPHSLTLASDFDQLCVADRENGRIQCFKPETGKFVREIRHPSFGREVFAVAYTPGGLLYAVNGKPYPGDREPVQAFVMNFSTGEIVDTFIPLRKNFEMPHDIVASEDRTVYVGDAHANTVWKFTSTEKMEHRSVKKAGIEIQEINAEAIIEGTLTKKPTSKEFLRKEERHQVVQQASSSVSFVLITTLLIIPVAVLLAIAMFIWWRKTRIYGADVDHKHDSSSGRILGRFRGKGSGGLNLGNFFASRAGYSRKGFDRLSTEGSDQEKEEDATDSEEEEPVSQPPAIPSSSS